MDYLPGETLLSVTRRYVKKIAQSKGMSNEEFMKDVIRTALDGGEGIGKDRYTGPSEFSIAMYCSALKAVDWCINLPHFFVNNFLWLFGYEKYSLPLMESEMPPNMPRIMDILFRFLIHSVVVGRYTNSDINGSHIIMLKDGRLGMVDMGQMLSLSETEAEDLCLLYTQVEAGDKARVKETVMRLGLQSPVDDEDYLFTFMGILLGFRKLVNVGPSAKTDFKGSWVSIFNPPFDGVFSFFMGMQSICLSLGYPTSIIRDSMLNMARKKLEKS